MAISPTEDKVRFGLFELDLKARQLSKNGTKIRLPQQPLQLLSILVERPGEILTREELRQRLWPSDVFVDFDHGLNKSVQKLRDALGDSADSPRYIETLPRVGYRFIPPVNGGTQLHHHESQKTIAQVAAVPVAQPTTSVVGKQRMYWTLLTACIALLLALAVGWSIHARQHPAGPIRSLAVLPLNNFSGDPNQEYFAEGMTDELITMLTKNSTLRIVSRSSVMQYKDVHRPLRQIAQELGVDGIVEGSVERVGDTVHMTVQLVQTPSNTYVWADSYDRDMNDVAALPEQVARAIARRLNSAIPQTGPQHYVNPEAHDAYLHGQYLWFANHNARAAAYFRKAIELQPDYALGWSGLAEYYGAGAIEGFLSPADSLAPMEAASARAVQLDDSLPEAHLTFGAAIFMNRWDWARADHEVLRAIQLNPQYAEAHHFRAKILAALNRHQEAIEEQKKASALDPFARPFALAYSYLLSRQYDAALTEARQRLESTPHDPNLFWVLSQIYRCQGMDKESVAMLQQELLSLGQQDRAVSVRRAFEKGGYQGVLREQIRYDQSQASKHYVSPYTLALLYAQLGEREKTLALLEESYRQHSPMMLWMQADPAFDFIHADPRYRSIIGRIGLPPAF